MARKKAQTAPPRSACVSVVAVSYHTGPCLTDCIASLIAQPEVGEVIVVDNGNDIQTTLWLEEQERHGRLTRISAGRNIGFATGCNLGVGRARCDYIALVNPDAIVPDGSFSRLLTIIEADPDIWLCGGRLLNMDGTEQRGGRRELLTPWRAFVEVSRLHRLFPNHPYFRRLNNLDGAPELKDVDVPVVSGAFMFLRKRHYQALGGMDDNIFLHVDDVDLCIRVLKAGGRVHYCGTVPIYHHLSTSDAFRCFVELHKARSSCYYFYKHFHHAYPAWVLLALSLLLWLRFFFVAVLALPRDLKKALGRLVRWLGRRRAGDLTGNARPGN